MRHDVEQLEHLFSRHLDGEATPPEREHLDRLLAEDTGVRARFADYETLDRLAGEAMRAALGRPRRIIALRPVRSRVARGLAIAAAACLATFAWFQPEGRNGAQPDRGVTQAGQAMRSWFLPQEQPGDQVASAPAAYERPELRMRGARREWIVIPGDRPGRYFVIEVDRVRTHVIGVHRDF